MEKSRVQSQLAWQGWHLGLALSPATQDSFKAGRLITAPGTLFAKQTPPSPI